MTREDILKEIDTLCRRKMITGRELATQYLRIDVDTFSREYSQGLPSVSTKKLSGALALLKISLGNK